MSLRRCTQEMSTGQADGFLALLEHPGRRQEVAERLHCAAASFLLGIGALATGAVMMAKGAHAEGATMFGVAAATGGIAALQVVEAHALAPRDQQPAPYEPHMCD